LDEQPVETTLYSLNPAPPEPDRRSDERHLSLLRVGSMTIGDRRELCLIKNISAGGMMIKAYCSIEIGTRISIELKHGEPVSGTTLWAEGDSIGVRFDQPVDVLALLTWSSDGPRPRMPRVEVDCAAWVREGAVVHRTRAVNISQGGIRVEAVQPLSIGADVTISLNGLEPAAGIVRWSENGSYGITFNRVLPLPALVEWLRDQRGRMRAA
jgi:PilZ domain-containing protein